MCIRDSSETDDALDYTFAMDVVRSAPVPLELAEGLAAEGLVLDSPLEVDLITSTSLDLVLGVDLGKLPSAGDAFSVHLGEGFSVAAAVDEAGLTQGGTVGFLEVEVQGGTAVIDAEVAVTPTDPDDPLTLSEMRSDAAEDLATQAGTGSLAIALPLGFAADREIPGVIEAGQTPKLVLSDANLFDAAGAELTTESFDHVADFRTITAKELLPPLSTLGDWMDRLAVMPAFDEWVPLTADLTFGYVLDPGVPWRAYVGDLISEEVTQESGFTSAEPTFATAQELAALLGGIVGDVLYDAASHELTFDIAYGHTFDPVESTVAFDPDLGTLGDLETASPIATTQAELDAAFSLGVYLRPVAEGFEITACLLYTSPSPRDRTRSRMPSSA